MILASSLLRVYKGVIRMDALQVLEQKITSLVSMVHELKAQKDQAHKDLEVLHFEAAELKNNNAKLEKENAQLLSKIDNIEKQAIEGNDQINELSEEKTLTKIAVDDLLERLKAIDSMVESQ